MLRTLVLAAWVGLQLAKADSWWWSWPSNTTQCENIQLLIGGGTPPWNVLIAPIWGDPLWWELTWNSTSQATFSQSNPLQFTIPLQLTTGTEYVVLGWDNSGSGYNQYRFLVGADFPPIQIVGASSNTTCLSPSRNVIQEFTFGLVGTTEQCGNNVQISWSDTNTSHAGPRSFSIVPLDSSYAPYQIGVSGASGTYTWSPDMKAGTKFTIMMGNGDAPGDGGVAGVYNVAAGTDSSCLTRTANSLTTQIPAAVVTSAMAAPSTTASTAVSNSTSSSCTSTSASASASATSPTRSVSSAVIGGAVGGAVGGILVISAVFIFFYLRRRNSKRSHNAVDLVDEDPKIQPFRGASDTQVQAQVQDQQPNRYTGYDDLAVASSSFSEQHDHYAHSATEPSSMSDNARRHSFSTADAATVLGGHSTNSAASTSGHAYAPHGGITPYPMYSPLSVNEDTSSARQHSYADSKRAILTGDTASENHRSSLTSGASPMVSPPMSTPTAAGGTAHPNEEAHFPGFDATQGSHTPPAANESSQPQFIRQVDAEVVEEHAESDGPVELPPMYSEVPRRSSRQ